MPRLLAACLVLAFSCSLASAQSEFKKPKHSGYFFVAPGAVAVNYDSQSSFQVGGGFEGFIYKGLGVGVEVGGLRVSSHTSSRQWTGMLSMNAVYDFQRTAKQKVCPFIAAGFTAIPQFDVGGGYNFGGGIKYWFGEHWGMRVALRIHARPGEVHTYDDVQGIIAIAIR